MTDHPEDPTPDEEPGLVGGGGHDVNAGINLSGVGGEKLRTDRPEAGLRPVDEEGERLGWGHLT